MEHIDIALTSLGYTYREVHAPISGLIVMSIALGHTRLYRTFPHAQGDDGDVRYGMKNRGPGNGPRIYRQFLVF